MNIVADYWTVIADTSQTKAFTIKSAAIEQLSKIAEVVQEAYFQEKLLPITHRDPAQKKALWHTRH
jgi:hypothetical protein